MYLRIYIEPSRQGMRGKHRWLHVNEDLQGIWEAKKHEVLLWCDGWSDESGKCKRKCASTNDRNSPDKKARTKNESISSKLEEVDAIYEKLKHQSVASLKQLRAWAHMIQMDHHSYGIWWTSHYHAILRILRSWALLQHLPLSHLKVKYLVIHLQDALCSQYIEQLGKWHSLLAVNAIFKAEYEEHRTAIMGDLRILWVCAQLPYVMADWLVLISSVVLDYIFSCKEVA